MQRLQAIHERLQRWAVWHHTARVKGGTVATSRWDADRGERVNYGPDTLISASDEEALITEMAVGALAFDWAAQPGGGLAMPHARGRALVVTVREVYLNREGRTLAQTAAILRVTSRTLHNTLCEIDRKIERWLAARAQMQADAAARDQVHAPHYRRALYAAAVD